MKIIGQWADIYLTKPQPAHIPYRRVVVSSKISKKAVTRNLIKRRLGEILRAALNKDIYLETLNIAVVAKPGIIDVNFHDLKKDVASAFEKSK